MTLSVSKRLTACCYLSVLGGCSGELPGPVTGPHQARADRPATVVSFPPPQVRAECVPERPRDQCVWVDGSWQRVGIRWEWQPGAWVLPPAGCYHATAYSRWIRVGEAEGGDRLYYFEANWYPNAIDGKCAAPRLCLAATPIEDC